MRLARVGLDDRLTAVAKLDMHHLNGWGRPTDHQDVVVPVELLGLV